MTTKHTPGPWVAVKLQDRTAYNIFVPGHCTALLTLEPGKYDGASPLCENVQANARLIAAAPDLLAALREAFRAFAFYDEGPVWADSTIAKARAAIARATGGAA